MSRYHCCTLYLSAVVAAAFAMLTQMHAWLHCLARSWHLLSEDEHPVLSDGSLRWRDYCD